MESVRLELRGHGDSVTGMALNRDGTFFADQQHGQHAARVGCASVAPANRCIKVLTGHQHTFEKHLLKCAWSGDGRRVTAGSGDRMVCVWDVHAQKLEYRLPGHTGSVNEAVFHPEQADCGVGVVGPDGLPGRDCVCRRMSIV